MAKSSTFVVYRTIRNHLKKLLAEKSYPVVPIKWQITRFANTAIKTKPVKI